MEPPKYKKEDLLRHIEKRKANIKVFEDAIQVERDEIEKELILVANADDGDTK